MAYEEFCAAQYERISIFQDPLHLLSLFYSHALHHRRRYVRVIAGRAGLFSVFLQHSPSFLLPLQFMVYKSSLRLYPMDANHKDSSWHPSNLR